MPLWWCGLGLHRQRWPRAGERSLQRYLMTWHLVTEPDEHDRCCIVHDGQRCEQTAAYHVVSSDGALDDYTYVCADHLHLVSGPRYVATRIES